MNSLKSIIRFLIPILLAVTLTACGSQNLTAADLKDLTAYVSYDDMLSKLGNKYKQNDDTTNIEFIYPGVTFEGCKASLTMSYFDYGGDGINVSEQNASDKWQDAVMRYNGYSINIKKCDTSSGKYTELCANIAEHLSSVYRGVTESTANVYYWDNSSADPQFTVICEISDDHTKISMSIRTKHIFNQEQ